MAGTHRTETKKPWTKKRVLGVPLPLVLVVVMAGAAVAGWLTIVSFTGTVSTSAAVDVELTSLPWVLGGDCTVTGYVANPPSFGIDWAPVPDATCSVSGEMQLVSGSPPAIIYGVEYAGGGGVIVPSLQPTGGHATCGLSIPADADPLTGDGLFKVTFTAGDVAGDTDYSFTAGDGLLIGQPSQPLLCTP